jgi:hypothetical protein
LSTGEKGKFDAYLVDPIAWDTPPAVSVIKKLSSATTVRNESSTETPDVEYVWDSDTEDFVSKDIQK